MNFLFGTVMTDGVVQENGKKILTKPIAIVNVLWDNMGLDIPLLKGHDFTKILGWTYNFGVYSEPGLTRLLMKSNLAENESEFEEVKQKILQSFHIRYKKNIDDFEYLENLIKSKLKEEYIYNYINCISIISKNILFKILPEIENSLDKDGLYNIENLTALGEGVYKYHEYAIYGHIFFRRSFHRYNSMNIPFFRRLDKINDKSSLKIRLDPNMIGLASTFKHSSEWEFWWGPKFNEDLSKIKNGEAVHGTYYNGELLKTFFRWGNVNGDKVFEVEELPEKGINLRNVDSMGLYGCRYAHSVYNPESKKFHFDGAIRGYNIDDYSHRLSLKLTETPKSQVYTKLWRYDGELSIIQWKELLTHYFRDNMLIGEYLSGKDNYLEERLLKDESNNVKDKIEEILIEDELSLKVMISFKEKQVNSELISSKICKFEDLPYVVLKQFQNFLELEKFDYTYLDDLKIQESLQKWCYIPPIFVSAQNLKLNLVKLNKIVKKWIKYLENKEICEYICLNFIFPIEKNLLNFSIIGKKMYIMQFFDQFKLINFEKYSIFEKWIENIIHFIYEIPKPSRRDIQSQWFSKNGFFKIGI